MVSTMIRMIQTWSRFKSDIVGILIRYSKISKRFLSAAKCKGVSGDSGLDKMLKLLALLHL